MSEKKPGDLIKLKRKPIGTGGKKEITMGDVIRQVRKSQGLSQQALADRMGDYTHSSISRIEKGQHDISQANLNRLAHALGTTASQLSALLD